MARVSAEKVIETRGHLLDAAQQILIGHGYSGLSTRQVAEAAGMSMSQIQYHDEPDPVSLRLEGWDSSALCFWAV